MIQTPVLYLEPTILKQCIFNTLAFCYLCSYCCTVKKEKSANESVFWYCLCSFFKKYSLFVYNVLCLIWIINLFVFYLLSMCPWFIFLSLHISIDHRYYAKLYNAWISLTLSSNIQVFV
jgi:hypothetical protein